MMELAPRSRLLAGVVLTGVAIPMLLAQETPVFPTGVEVVNVDVVVLDRKGQPVEGLNVADFTVLEDGVAQTIASFEALVLPESRPAAAPTRMRVSANTAPPPARTFIIVFDDAHLTVPQAARSKKQLAAYLKEGLAPGDEVTLVPTAGGAWWTATTPDGYSDLVAAMARLKGTRQADFSAGHMTDYEAMRLYVARDKEVSAQVLRRFLDDGTLTDFSPLPRNDPHALDDLNLPGARALLQARAAQSYVDVTTRNKATLRALERAAQAVAAAKGRKSLILISPGFIYDATLDAFRSVIEACRRANAAIYFLDARGVTGLPVGGDAERQAAVEEQDLGASLLVENRESDGAASLAADSGGFVFGSNDIAGGLRRVVMESRAYYLIGYQSTNTRRDGKFRKIKVQVRRAALDVRARRGYYPPSVLAAKREVPAGEEAFDPKVRAALDSPYDGDDIPLRLTSLVLGPAPAGKSSVILVAEADAKRFGFREEQARFIAALDSYVIVSSRERGTNETQEKRIDLSLPAGIKQRIERSWLPFVRTFELDQGAYQARLLLRDSVSGHVGTVRHEFEVPALGSFRATTPILTDLVDTGPSGNTRPVPVAHRAFAVGSRLVHYFEVYEAAADPHTGNPQVSVSYMVQRRPGKPVAIVGPRPMPPGPLGQLSQQTVLPLHDFAPGEYEILVTVKDEVGGQTVEMRDDFAVVPPS